MLDLKGKIVVITGASSGIGKACAEVFALHGAVLALCARNITALDIIAEELRSKYNITVDTYKTDVRDKSEVAKFINSVIEKNGVIDILINNAGLALGLEKFESGDINDWEIMIDTNIKGLLYVTKEAIAGLKKSDAGLVINIGSLAGVAAYQNGAVYCATKAAVKFISDGLRQDTVDTNIRVTNIQPGMVETNFSIIRFHGDKDKADNVYKGIKPLSAEDIADMVLYAAKIPNHVQICELTVTPMHQATGGVVFKEKR